MTKTFANFIAFALCGGQGSSKDLTVGTDAEERFQDVSTGQFRSHCRRRHCALSGHESRKKSQ